jgi:tetratricopeptide (TPR) repeat protein
MSSDQPDRDTIFSRAIAIVSPEEREAYIVEACGDDTPLRQQIEERVAAHFQAGSRARKHLRAVRAVTALVGLSVAAALGSGGVALWAWRAAGQARAAAEVAGGERRQALQEAAASRSECNQAVVAQQVFARQRDQALAAQQTTQQSQDDLKAVLSFVRDNLLAAARPPGETGAGLGKNVTLRQAVTATEAKVGPVFRARPLAEALARALYGSAYEEMGEAALAVKEFERALALREALLGPNHPDTITSRNELAVAYRLAGRPDAASRLYEQDPDLPSHAAALAIRGAMLLARNEPAEAESELREGLAVAQRIQPDDWTTFDTRSLLGEALLMQQKYADAQPLLLSAYEGLKQRQAGLPAEGRGSLTRAATRLVQLYKAWGKNDQAARWQEVLESLPPKTPLEAQGDR